jgi:hypothetical protein
MALTDGEGNELTAIGGMNNVKPQPGQPGGPPLAEGRWVGPTGDQKPPSEHQEYYGAGMVGVRAPGASAKPVAQLVTTKPDAEVAAEFKKRMIEVGAPITALFDEIRAAGFQAQLSWGMGPLGNFVITLCKVAKEY